MGVNKLFDSGCTTPRGIIRNAVFSPCRTYRYELARYWQSGSQICNFILLNPSKADAQTDDATVRRCIRYAHDWGYAGLVITNLFAFRSTDPRQLKMCPDPFGPENYDYLRSAAYAAGVVVCGWGEHGRLHDWGQEILELLQDMGIRLHALRLTAGGHPHHPLRLPANLRPRPLKELRRAQAEV